MGEASIAETQAVVKTCADEVASTSTGGGSETGDKAESLDGSSSPRFGSEAGDADKTVMNASDSYDSAEWMPNGRHVVWMPDEAIDGCLKCSKPFTFLRRRHHCRACGLIFCAECAPRTSNRRGLQKGEVTHKRVCMDCAGGLGLVPTDLPAKAPDEAMDGQPESEFAIRNTFVCIQRSPSVERLFDRAVASFPL